MKLGVTMLEVGRKAGWFYNGLALPADEDAVLGIYDKPKFR